MLPCSVLVAAVLAVGAHAMPDAELQAEIDQFDVRRDEMLRRQLADPYPGEGVWHYADFALAGLYLNERVDEANEAILHIRREFPVGPDPRRASGDPEVDDFHWSINLLQRIYFLFSAESSFFPARLTPEAETALREIFWDSARRHCRIEYADPERTWWIWGSENHGAMRSSGFWGTAHILKDSPEYRDRRYEDGSTPAEMAAAWDAFYRRFAQERAGKGLLVEIASTYNKYTLQGWYNMADFATDPVLKKRMKMLLGLFWADWAIEQIDGVRGGGKHRIYPGRNSTATAFFSGSGMSWYYFGLGAPRSQHPGHMCAATSTYRPPLCVVDMALDVEGRGTYEYVSRRMGLNVLPKPEEADWQTYVMQPDYGGILRYTYCTPDFIMGTSMVEARPHEEWAAISSQNRWDGVVFGGARDACIFAQPLKPERGSVYNSHRTIQHKGVMILQKLRTHRHAHGQRVWFAESLQRTEEDGWVFSEAPAAYAACRVASGATHWEDAVPEDGAAGAWLACEDEYAPIILEVARSSDVDDFEAFRAAIRANQLSLDDGVLHYRSSFYGDEFTFHTESASPPELNGQPLDFRPSKAYGSPFIQSEWGSGVVVLQKDGRRVVLDFNEE